MPVGEGLGEPEGDPVGDPDGESVGEAVGLAVETVKVNESEQAAGVGTVSWALGWLDGTFGATGCWRSW